MFIIICGDGCNSEKYVCIARNASMVGYCNMMDGDTCLTYRVINNSATPPCGLQPLNCISGCVKTCNALYRKI